MILPLYLPDAVTPHQVPVAPHPTRWYRSRESSFTVQAKLYIFQTAPRKRCRPGSQPSE